jgi:hypothetical protein
MADHFHFLINIKAHSFLHTNKIKLNFLLNELNLIE